VSGSLEDMGITDIVQVLNMGMKTAKVILTHAKDKGEIYLKSGVIVYVQLGELTGNDAFFEMIGWEKGDFRILHGHVTDKMNITMDTMTLLLEASKFMDEKRYAAGKGKSVSLA
jgi:two-component system chemotaxis response regulator CheB